MASKGNPGGGSGSVGSPIPKPPNPGGGSGTVGGSGGVPAPAKPPQYTNVNGAGYRPTAPRPKPITVPVAAPGAGYPGGAVPGGGGTSGDGTAPGASSSAKQQLMNDLANMGLDANAQAFKGSPQSLGDWVWGEWLNSTDEKQILLDLKTTEPYKYAYSGMTALQAQGINISEKDYRDKETADLEVLRRYGVPDQMAQDKTFLGNLIGNQVSTAELQGRLSDYASVVQQVGGETMDYLRSAFGINSGDLLGFWLNPDMGESLIHQKVAAAQIGGAAAMSGLNALDPTVALHLAGLGVSAAQAASGFGKIAGQTELTRNLGDGTGSVDQNTLIDAQLGGNGQAANAVDKVAAQRVAKFQQGGTFAANSSGVTGLGVGSQGF